MPAVARFDHFGLAAPPGSFDAMLDFYEQAFGWRRFTRPLSRKFDYRIEFLADGAGFSLEVFEIEHEPVGGRHHLALVVPRDRFDEIYARVRRAGAPATEPEALPTGTIQTFVTDPGGNRVQVIGRPEGLPTPTWSELS